MLSYELENTGSSSESFWAEVDLYPRDDRLFRVNLFPSGRPNEVCASVYRPVFAGMPFFMHYFTVTNASADEFFNCRGICDYLL